MKSDTHFATTKLPSETHCKVFVSSLRAPNELLLEVLKDADVGVLASTPLLCVARHIVPRPWRHS